MFNTFYPNVFILFSIAFTPTIVFVDARLCNLATLVLETIGFTVTTPSLTPITFPRAIVSVILTPDKLFVFLTISTFALDGIVTTKLSPTFGVLLISPILITNLSLEAETIFACNFFRFSISTSPYVIKSEISENLTVSSIKYLQDEYRHGQPARGCHDGREQEVDPLGHLLGDELHILPQ